MKNPGAFLWTLIFTLCAIIGVLCFPAPVYAMCASSIIHALLVAIGIGNPVFGYIVFAYIFGWIIYLITCCVLSYRGVTKPSIVAMIMDLTISVVYFLYVIFALDGRPEYFAIEIGCFFFRILYLIIGLTLIPKSARRDTTAI